MPVFAGDPVQRNRRYLEDYTAPLGQVLGAESAMAWLRAPLDSIDRHFELERLNNEQTSHHQRARSRLGLPVRKEEDLSPKLDREEARSRVEETGLELDIPEEGIREEALDWLINQKREERALQSILRRAPAGFGATALRFGANLGTSMLDPINVGAAFVPVAGQARYARAISNAGTRMARAGVRARYGALEGTVGAAMVEPIVYGQARSEQADYSLMDSLVNVGVGSIMGSGLHMGAGALGDALSRARPGSNTAEAPRAQSDQAAKFASYSTEQRRSLLQAALGQELSGRAANVEAMVNHIDGVESVRPSTLESARRQVREEWRSDMEHALKTEMEPRMRRGERQQLEQRLQEIEYEQGRAGQAFRTRTRQLQRDEGLRRREAEARVRQVDEARRQELDSERSRIEQTLRDDDVARAAEADLSRLEQGIIPERFRARIDEEAQSRAQAAQTEPSTDTMARAQRSRPEIDLDQRWSALREAAVMNQRSRAFRDNSPETAQQIETELDRQMRQPETVEEAQRQVTELQSELQQLQREVGEDSDLNAVLGLDGDEMRNLDAGIQQAAEMRNGLRAMAACTMRKGGTA